jgi:hypothetical protein
VSAPAPWLNPDDVRGWLALPAAGAPGADPADEDRLAIACGSAQSFAERCRPEFRDDAGVYTPDAEVSAGAVQLAARIYRRRLSSGGIESFGDNVLYTPRFDPEIERALRIGAYAMPGVG